jgi:hypothetical protein
MMFTQPLEQFEIIVINPINIVGFNFFLLTISLLSLFLIIGLYVFFFSMGLYRTYIISFGFQYFAEQIYLFV